MVYERICVPGDSGAVLLLHDGRIIGMHLEQAAVLVEKLERLEIIHDGLDDLRNDLLDAARIAGLVVALACWPTASQRYSEQLLLRL